MLCWYLLVLAATCVMDSGFSALSLGIELWGERKMGRSDALQQRRFGWELCALHLALGINFLLLQLDDRSACCKLLLFVPFQVEKVQGAKEGMVPSCIPLPHQWDSKQGWEFILQR